MAHSLELSDGTAEHMGDGFFVVCQRDEYDVDQSVGLSVDDLRAMLAAAEGSEQVVIMRPEGNVWKRMAPQSRSKAP